MCALAAALRGGRVTCGGVDELLIPVLEYHHGDTGPRPETVWGNLRFDFSTVSVELAPSP